ncbi:putative bacteriophage protein [Escherichia coli]|uniref:Putative bacteriophage protein n=1 Tax=Escherichia coli TaxID=562 RepID=A0A2X3M166_ECOLX|nr:putative bacteriophage protein [Escherichia coli]
MSEISYQASITAGIRIKGEEHGNKPEDELSNIVLFPVKEDDPRNQVNFLYEPSERPYCHHASVRVDEKERQVRCKICGAVVEPFDWMLSVAKRETRLADDVRLLRQEERERRKI